MKRFYFFLSIPLLLTLLSHRAFGQEPRVFSQYFMNPFIYNPSYAGVEGHSVLFLMYRQQWAAIDGAPAISHVSFHTPFANGMGVGGSIFNETMGLMNNVGVKGSASYLVNIDRSHWLRFGMSLGVGTSSINFAELDDPTDPAFTNLVSDKLYTIGEFGMTYHTGHFNFGIALPSLFSQDVVSEVDFNPVRVRPMDRVLLKANYRGHISDDFAFEPHLIYRYSKNTANQFEASAIVHIKHLIWTGASYRQDAGFIGLIGTKIKESLGIGYAVELGKPEITNLTGNTHEIHIGYHIGSRKNHASHASSFIKSHRLTADERAAKAEEERLKKLAELSGNQTTVIPKPEEEKEEETLPLAPTDEQIIVTDRETGEQKIVEKADLKNVWTYQKPPSMEAVTRVNREGKVETAVVMTRTTDSGTQETIIDFLPVPAEGSKETWSIANPDAIPPERTNEAGEKEVGIEWVRTDQRGNMQNVMKWSKVYEGSVSTAQLIDDIEGIVIPDRSRIPQMIIDENLRPDEKVEDLKLTFDNTSSKEQVVKTPAEEIAQEQLPTQERETITAQDQPPVSKEEPSVRPDGNQIPADKDAVTTYKRGNHMLELPVGNHIIAGAFESFENAEKFSDRLFERGFIDIKVGYISEKNLYYVVLNSFDDVRRAQTERNRIRRTPEYAEVWLLTIER